VPRLVLNPWAQAIVLSQPPGTTATCHRAWQNLILNSGPPVNRASALGLEPPRQPDLEKKKPKIISWGGGSHL
jgi:hypothetical protein